MKLRKSISDNLIPEFREYMNAVNKNSPVGTGWYVHIENAVGEFMKAHKITGDVTEAVTQYFLMDKE